MLVDGSCNVAGVSPNTGKRAPPDLGWDSLACSAGSHLLLEICVAPTNFSTEALSAISSNVCAAVDFGILIEPDRIGLLAALKR